MAISIRHNIDTDEDAFDITGLTRADVIAIIYGLEIATEKRFSMPRVRRKVAQEILPVIDHAAAVLGI